MVRLCDVHPSGESLRVSYGVLNLAHRDGHEELAPLAAGQRYRVHIQLNDAGSVFPAGHRIRLAISTAYWPMIWPAPERATLLISGGALELPVRAPRPTDALLNPLPGPELAPPEKPTIIHRDHMRIERIDRLGLELGTQVESNFTSRRTTRSAQRPSCDGRGRCRGTHGKFASRRRCGCPAPATSSCCRAIYARGTARTRFVIANGTSLFLETSFEYVMDRAGAMRLPSCRILRFGRVDGTKADIDAVPGVDGADQRGELHLLLLAEMPASAS